MPEVSIVIPTLGRPSLSRVLDGFEQQRPEAQAFEVLVVADAKAENPLALAERPYPLRMLVASSPGASAARNAGRRAARAELLLFTDDDTAPTVNLVAEHLRWHRDHPAEEIAVLGYVRWAPELRVTPFMRWLDHGIQFDYPSIRGIEAGWGRFYGANVSVKASFVDRVGGFDEERFPYLNEDLEFAYRGSLLGLRVLYNRHAVANHLRPMTLELWQRRARLIAAAERRLVTVHPEIRPYFHEIFAEALSFPPATGRGVRLLPYVPRWIPRLGPRVWASADRFFKQAIARHFLPAWEEAERSEAADDVQLEVSERVAESSGGCIPGGPK